MNHRAPTISACLENLDNSGGFSALPQALITHVRALAPRGIPLPRGAFAPQRVTAFPAMESTNRDEEER